jgi:hypothetical protein
MTLSSIAFAIIASGKASCATTAFMRIADQLYFAPNIRFRQLDLTGDVLPDQFGARIRGFYLDPAISLAKKGHAFSCGVLLVVTIDAIARVCSTKEKVGERMKDWCESNLPSLSTQDMRRCFYEDFRNGLVHEARVKNGSEFNLDENHAASLRGSRLVVNPRLLADEIASSLAKFIATLKSDYTENQRFLRRLQSEFEHELTHSDYRRAAKRYRATDSCPGTLRK